LVVQAASTSILRTLVERDERIAAVGELTEQAAALFWRDGRGPRSRPDGWRQGGWPGA